MKLISWNCRGVGNRQVIRHAKLLLRSSHADAACFLETKTKNANAMLKMTSKLGFLASHIVDPLGFAGGLLLVWNPSTINLQMVLTSSQAIHTVVSEGGKDFHVSFAYVRPNNAAKERFWEDNKVFSGTLNSPWILMGDLNDIGAVDEQWGSDGVNMHCLNKFRTAYNNCGLLDLDSAGPTFTWCRTMGGRTIARRRLDRVLWNMEAQLNLPEAKALVLPRVYSDHNPIMFMSSTGEAPPRANRT